MRVVTLLENNTIDDSLQCAHGLSLYIEYKDKKMLFDIGPGNQYLKNAKKLNIDIKDVDYLIISHGHKDHAAKLSKFLKVNKKAQVFIAEEAFEKHYKVYKNVYLPIGIKQPNNNRITFVDKDMEIKKGIRIYKNIKPIEQIITDNALLKRDSEKMYVKDDFDHEIYLVIKDEERYVLFSGCSHKGLEHIIDTIEDKERPFTAVIGGFHFSHYDPTDLRQNIYLETFGKKINDKAQTTCYTCHCTGDEAFLDLKQTMKDKLVRIKTGSEFTL